MSDLATLHWTALKKMCEERGGRYEGKEQAIAFLSGDPQPLAPVVSAQEAPAVVSGDVVRFDKTKDYGLVTGDIEDMPGARYFQAGHFFNVRGEMVG